jgi:hypothetical protein
MLDSTRKSYLSDPMRAVNESGVAWASFGELDASNREQARG